jgi:hypothetical protein
MYVLVNRRAMPVAAAAASETEPPAELAPPAPAAP